MLAALLVIATASNVFLDGELAPAVRGALVDEIGAARISTSTGTASLRCRIERAPSALDVSCSGPTSWTRRVAIVDGDERAAIRVAVLLVARATERAPTAKTRAEPVSLGRASASSDPPRGPAARPVATPRAELDARIEPSRIEPSPIEPSRIEPSPVEPPSVADAIVDPTLEGAPGSAPKSSVVGTVPPPDKSKWSLDLGVGLSSTLWSRPLTPRLGPAINARVGIDRWRFGAGARFLGLLCCSVDDAVVVEANALVLGVDVGRVLFERGPWSAAAFGSVGLRRLSGTARSTVFAGTGTTEDVAMLQGLGGIGAEIELGIFDPVRLVLYGGATVTVGPRTIALPPAFAGAEDAVHLGRFAPWLAFDARARFF